MSNLYCEVTRENIFLIADGVRIAKVGGPPQGRTWIPLGA
jgi:hypothetical protein